MERQEEKKITGGKGMIDAWSEGDSVYKESRRYMDGWKGSHAGEKMEVRNG